MATTAAAQQLRHRIAFEMNVPVEVALDRDGNPTESTARDGSAEWRYFLSRHSIMWIPTPVHEAIQRHRPEDGQAFSLTKHRSPKPWTVIALEDEPGNGYSGSPSPTPPAPPVRENTEDRAAAAYRAAITAAEAAMVRTPQGWIHRAPAQAAPDASTQAAPPALRAAIQAQAQLDPRTAAADQLAAAIATAIDAAADAAAYAEQRGMRLQWSASDIRAMAATLFIASTGGR